MQRRKAISREQIINMTLNLLRDKQDVKGLNLREIARALGCAHTNLYNYFSSFTDLLWSAHTALLSVMMEMIRESLAEATTAEQKLRYFFDTIVRIYLDHTGWFLLAWVEHIGDEWPADAIAAVSAARGQLDQYIAEIWQELSGNDTEDITVSGAVHNAHCYIVGEISNYIAGRRFIENPTEFKDYVTGQAICILTLCLRKE